MSYLNFTFLSMKKNIAAFVLAILEIAALFLAVNYSVSAILDRQMLNAPFKKILDQNTVYVYDTHFWEKNIESQIDSRKSRQMMLDEISGDYKIYDVLDYYAPNYTIISVSDEIYSRLEMPLISGKYGNAVGTFGTKSGENLVTVGGEKLAINVSGILTANTYLPRMNSFTSAGFTTYDIFDTFVNQPNVILTNRTAISGLEDKFKSSIGFFINIEQDYEENCKNLANVGGIVLGNDIIKNSKAALKDDLISFAPALMCVLCIVIIGILCISAILARQNEYRNGVMWLCGYSKKQMLWSHAVNVLTMLIISVAVGAAVFGILRTCEIEFAVTMNLSLANLISSAILCALLLGISLIIPAKKSANRSPIEYLGRTK